MIYMMGLLLAVEIAIQLVASAHIPYTSFHDFISNPSLWDLTAFISSNTTTMLAIGISTVVIGGLVIKNDLMTFAGLAIMLFSFGAQFVYIPQLIVSQSSESLGNFVSVVSYVVTAIFVIVYIFIVIEWWRGRD